MVTANIKGSFSCGLEETWNVVASLEDYEWRSGLEKIEILEAGKKFIEHTVDGYQTTFTITAFEPFSRYEFDMENSNMSGHWTGIFSTKGGKTYIDFTEEVTAKKWWLKPLVGIYLRKQQAMYIEDLKRVLE